MKDCSLEPLKKQESNCKILAGSGVPRLEKNHLPVGSMNIGAGT